MSDIDTAEIRGALEAGDGYQDYDVLDLCDALDAARDDGLAALDHAARLRARAEAAEARIAAALHYVGDPDEWPVPTMAPIMGKVYRLLTEGTE